MNKPRYAHPTELELSYLRDHGDELDCPVVYLGDWCEVGELERWRAARIAHQSSVEQPK
jgi:hypothetical protein